MGSSGTSKLCEMNTCTRTYPKPPFEQVKQLALAWKNPDHNFNSIVSTSFSSELSYKVDVFWLCFSFPSEWIVVYPDKVSRRAGSWNPRRRHLDFRWQVTWPHSSDDCIRNLKLARLCGNQYCSYTFLFPSSAAPTPRLFANYLPALCDRHKGRNRESMVTRETSQLLN